MDKLRELHCVQLWSDDVWRTVYVSSFYGDAAEVFQNELYEWDGPKRFVTFSVEGVDFIAPRPRDTPWSDARVDACKGRV